MKCWILSGTYKPLCEISFLEFQIVVNISLKEVKNAFNYPRPRFNLIYYPRNPKESQSSENQSLFFSAAFFSRWIRLKIFWMLSSQHATRWFGGVRNKMSVKNHLCFCSRTCPVVTLCLVFHFQSQHAIWDTYLRSKRLKIREVEKNMKTMGNGFIDSRASYYLPLNPKVHKKLMVLHGLEFKTRQ